MAKQVEDGIDPALLIADRWYVVRDFRTTKWPYTQARAVNGPHTSAAAAKDYCVERWGERPLRWTGTAWNPRRNVKA